ncbi:hypothetical protein [Pseudonocardia sp. WMMC193]|uniref:hypothetical protein n=1 Tax=Pseudonocardia sp. WMMC193 TaxID=2911965 RepID=UPI001F35F246|nr:hypothetical protein [Pseudonocardia sp. WMMC193]MCF7552664.1 hypothetical protein [Pseudonocardia sp. WMMC193]
MSTAECAFCNRTRRVKDRVDGAARCATCRNRDPATWKECSGCARPRPVNARTADGLPLCVTCYAHRHAPVHRCDQCGRPAPAATRRKHHDPTSQTLCNRCLVYPQRPCGGCGRTRRVAVRATATSPDLCPTCHQAPMLTCHRCGVVDLCRTTGPGRAPICFRCQLTARLDKTLTPTGTDLHPGLIALREAIATVDNPRVALNWLHRSPAARLLTAITAGELPLTHTTLDDAAHEQASPTTATSIDHLRRLLVAAGALPERDEALARLRQRADDAITRLTHPADQALLRSYLTWHLLRRVRERAEHEPLTPAALAKARNHITAATRLISGLRTTGHTLSDATQADLDSALAAIPNSRAGIDFLTWAHRHHRTGYSTPTTPARQPPRDFIDDNHRVTLSRKLLHDPTIPTADRVAGLLVLLYGQRASTICRLTHTDITHLGDEVIGLNLGREKLLVPPALAALITRLPDGRPGGIAATLADHQWLFPGRRPDRPADPSTIMRRLARHGLPLRLTRNAALLHLAAELPPIVIADLLGIHPGTAHHWADAAAGRWTTYAAHRGRSH